MIINEDQSPNQAIFLTTLDLLILLFPRPLCLDLYLLFFSLDDEEEEEDEEEDDKEEVMSSLDILFFRFLTWASSSFGGETTLEVFSLGSE